MDKVSQHFTRKEFACRCGCGFDTVDIELLQVLEGIRGYLDSPVYISSACRCISHNHKVGGKPKSKHRLGIAADISVRGVEPLDVQLYLLSKYLDKYGIGSYDSFTHIDVRASKARW